MIAPIRFPSPSSPRSDSFEEVFGGSELSDVSREEPLTGEMEMWNPDPLLLKKTDFWLKVLVLIQCIGRAIFLDTQGTGWGDIVCSYDELMAGDDSHYSEQFSRLVYRINYLNPPGENPLFVELILKPYSESCDFQNRLPSSQRSGSLGAV